MQVTQYHPVTEIVMATKVRAEVIIHLRDIGVMILWDPLVDHYYSTTILLRLKKMIKCL